MNFEIPLYELCPCGSGEKYKFCCLKRAKRRGKYPIGVIALYVPDDRTTTKIVASVHLGENDIVLERFVGSNILHDPKTVERIHRFFAPHGIGKMTMTSGNFGCPHEEGEDFPRGQDCPFCPYWAGKQGSARRE